MNQFDVNELRDDLKILGGLNDIDDEFTFFYDESNNIRKFYIRETDFNEAFNSNFVLGGIVYKETNFDIEEFFKGLKLQKSVKEVKLKHIAKGTFVDCLKSSKLKYFLTGLLKSDLYCHYSTVNVLYFSLVDIVDSAIVNSEVSMELGIYFSRLLKNDLFKLAQLEIESVIELFNQYGYPNIKEDSVLSFIESLIHLFEGYEDTEEFHVGLTSLKQILKDSKKEGTLPFIMDEEDLMLLKDFSQFYLRPIYLFKNSNHIFDKEDSVEPLLDEFELNDSGTIIKPYSFEDSIGNLYIQASDIFIGLLGKFSTFVNSNSLADLMKIIEELNSLQKENLKIFMQLIEKSENRNRAFIHSVASNDEMIKTIEIHRKING